MSLEGGYILKKRFLKLTLIIMIIMIIVGFILILFSNSIGQKIGTDSIQEGNTTITSEDPTIVEANTHNFRIVGSILSLIGGFGMLLSGFVLYKEL